MAKLSVPSPAPLRLLILLAAVDFYILTAAGLGFRCATDGMTCAALVGYIPENTTTIGGIASLFQLQPYTDLLAPNSLPSDTPQSQTVPSGQTVRIPIPCLCQNGIGTSYRMPVYFVNRGDSLYYITTIFSQLVDYQSIAAANGITSLVLTEQSLRIPLPCSCDPVDGHPITHYALVVQKGNTQRSIASEYNTSVAVLVKLNNLNNSDSLLAGQVLDVPLPPGAADPPIPAGSIAYPLSLSLSLSVRRSSTHLHEIRRRVLTQATPDRHAGSRVDWPWLPGRCAPSGFLPRKVQGVEMKRGVARSTPVSPFVGFGGWGAPLSLGRWAVLYSM